MCDALSASPVLFALKTRLFSLIVAFVANNFVIVQRCFDVGDVL